jgi:hypothetical protein
MIRSCTYFLHFAYPIRTVIVCTKSHREPYLLPSNLNAPFRFPLATLFLTSNRTGTDG